MFPVGWRLDCMLVSLMPALFYYEASILFDSRMCLHVLPDSVNHYEALNINDPTVVTLMPWSLTYSHIIADIVF